jgi:mRNA interferase MazF
MAEDLTRGEVRLYRFPKPDKERPVVVLTRTAALKHLTRVTVAPITSTIRDIPTEVRLDETDGMKRPCAVNLDNVVTVPRANLGRCVAVLRRARLAEICEALEFAMGCEKGA